jgi:hypothetical protein
LIPSVCFNVSMEHTASIFRVKELFSEAMGKQNVTRGKLVQPLLLLR